MATSSAPDDSDQSEFGLVRLVLGSHAFLPIAAERFQRISDARDGLFECLYIEENFDLVIQNYLEMERALLDSATHLMVHGPPDQRWFQLQLALFNRRMANLLSAARQYVDHTTHHARALFGEDSDEVREVIATFNGEYDSRLGYRVLEALRNYVQHRGFPIHRVTFPSEWVERPGGSVMLYGVSPYLRLEDLRGDHKFKRSVLEELDASGGEHDLKELVRDYLEGLWGVQKRIRELAQPIADEWRKCLCEAVAEFKHMFPDEDSYLVITAGELDGGVAVRKIALFDEITGHLDYLIRSNLSLTNLSRRYVTSEVIKKGARPPGVSS